MKTLEYRAYPGSIEYCKEDNMLFGKVLGIKSLVSYEGNTGKELEMDFKVAIDDYLDTCQEEGIVAEKPFKGSFNVRIPHELHQKAAILAMKEKTVIEQFCSRIHPGKGEQGEILELNQFLPINPV